MTDARLDIAASPKRIFTVEEANRLLPAIEEIFREMDAKSIHARELSDLVDDLESYWGEAVREPGNEDHESFMRVQENLSETLREVNDLAMRLSDLGCQLKDPNRGLVDFFTYVNGELAYLCWHRGEEGVRYWHTLEGGFAGRRPVPE